MIGLDDTLAGAAPLPTVGPLERALELRTLPLFRSMRAREVATLAQLAREYGVPRDATLAHAGERVRTVYILRDGRVRLVRDETAPVRVEAPDVVGLIEWLSGQPLAARLVADTDVTALAIDTAALSDVLEEDFPLVLHVRALLGAEIAAHEAALGWYDMGVARPARPGSAAVERAVDFVDLLVRLQDVAELRPLGVAVLAALLRDEGTIEAAAGEALFTAHEAAKRFLVIVSGEAVCTPSEPHRAFRAGPGDAPGRDAALAGTPYSYTAVAATPLVAIPIDARVFWDLAEDHFHVALTALAICARRLIALRARRADLDATAPSGGSGDAD